MPGASAPIENVIYINNQAYVVQYAPVSIAATGALIAATASKIIYLLSYNIVAAGSVTAQFKTSSGASLSGAMSMVVGVPIIIPGESIIFGTVAGDALNLNLGSAVQVSGHLSYVLV